MLEYRINYNPFTKNYIAGNQSHTIQLYNKGKQKSFNDYIRGIIIDNTLYLRLYYPFNDIDNLTSDKLYRLSYNLLKENERDILQAIKNHEKIIITKILYNVNNDLLKDLKLANI